MNVNSDNLNFTIKDRNTLVFDITNAPKIQLTGDLAVRISDYCDDDELFHNIIKKIWFNIYEMSTTKNTNYIDILNNLYKTKNDVIETPINVDMSLVKQANYHEVFLKCIRIVDNNENYFIIYDNNKSKFRGTSDIISNYKLEIILSFINTILYYFYEYELNNK